jgi:hypothetical protein
LHHVIHRADGGSHDASNIILCCSSCHQAHHAGILTISGTAEELTVRRPEHAATTTSVDRPDGDAIDRARVSDTAIPVTTAAAGDTGRVSASRTLTGGGCDAAAATGTTTAARADHEVAAMAGSGASAHVGTARITPAMKVDSTPRSIAIMRARTATTSSASDRCASNALASAADPAVASGANRAAAGSDHFALSCDTAPLASACAAGGEASKLDAAVLRAQAKAALTGLGWKPAIANAAVAAAVAALDAEATLESLIFESLRRCPKPRA